MNQWSPSKVKTFERSHSNINLPMQTAEEQTTYDTSVDSPKWQATF